MEKKNYNTKSRKFILDFLRQNQTVMVTVQEILSYLKDNGIVVNRSTIYRYINQLCEDGLIMKYIDNEKGKTVYQFVEEQHDCHSHIHMKCVKCNKIMHLECHFMEEIRKHLKQSHHFELQCEGSVLYGICDECSKKNLK